MDDSHLSDLETEVHPDRPPGAQAVASERHPFLQMLTGADAGRLVELRGGEVSLGRAEGVDVVVGDTSVSRVHARLRPAEGRAFRILDAGSRNGTWVRGERVTEEVVHDGDLFSLGGRVTIKLAWYDAEEAALMARLYERAVRDADSGLLNRPYFIERAAQLLARAQRQHARVAAAIIAPQRVERASQWRQLADVLATCPDALVGRWEESSLAVISPRGRAALDAVLERLPLPARCGAAESVTGNGVEELMQAVAEALVERDASGVTWSAAATVPAGPPAPSQPRRDQALLEICCFGRGTARAEGMAVPDEAFKTQKTRWLLAHLASAGPHGVTEDELQDLYWPDGGLGGRKSLNTALSTLRKALGDRCAEAIHRGGGFVRLRDDLPIWCDVDAFESLLSQAAVARRVGDGGLATQCLEEAVALHGGAFIAGCYLDWALRRRELYERKMTDALCELATASIEANNAERALAHASRAVEIDPFQQDAHQLIVRAHTRLGRPDRAIRHFERFSRALLDELGVEPSIALVEECLRARLGLDPRTTL